MIRTAFALGCAAACALGAAGRAAAQGRVVPPPTSSTDTVRAAPGARYEAGSMHRFLLGDNWRDLWSISLTLPVLRIDTFAGGLKPEREGGNKQSVTLHFVDAAGKGWVFRSLDKYPSEKISDAVNGTLVGDVIQDQISALHPAGALMIPPLLQALDVLHVEPVPYVMADDSALGEFRQRFAGMIGMLEPKPNEGPDDTPGFAGSLKIHDTKDMFEQLEESSEFAVAQRELLRVRLLDFITGDTDRSTDQYRWVRFPHPTDGGRLVYRPLPRDRDWAFLRPQGVIAGIARRTAFAKFTAFGPRHSDIAAHTFTGHVVDRRLLTELDRSAFVEEVATVQAVLTDSVIDEAVRRLPASYPASHARWIAEAMRARRDALPAIAHEFYVWLASEVDVRGTDESDRAEIVRHDDGRVEVSLLRHGETFSSPNRGGSSDGDEQDQSARYYHRTFDPEDTNEVRVFLHGDADVAVIRGTSNAIAIRVLGGGGDDVLADSSGTGGVYLYDDRGDNRFVRASRTHVDARSWDQPQPPEGLRADIAWAPDWGGSQGWGFLAGYGEAAGVIVGAGPSWTDYGFRRLPYHWRVDARALRGLSAAEFGAELFADYRLENSASSVEALLRYSRFEGFRWFGLGNTTVEVEDDQSLVRYERFSFEPSFVWRTQRSRPEPDDSAAGGDAAADSANAGAAASSEAQPGRALEPLHASISAGPVLRYTAVDAVAGTAIALQQPFGVDPLWQAGAGARIELARTDGRAAPRRGLRFRASAAGYPGWLDSEGASAHAAAEANAYVSVPGDALRLALRAGGIRAFGDYPAFDAAMLGGRSTLRGFEFQRFAGDAAAFGGAELRAPLGRIELLVRGELGAFALVDAGRVWVGGESPGGWHAGYGGGLSFEALGRALSVALASGEREQLYVWLGLPF